MKVLFNGLSLIEHFTGVQYYAESLLRGFNQLGLINKTVYPALSSKYKGQLDITGKIDINNKTKINRIIFEHFKLDTLKLKNIDFDLVHCPAYIIPKRKKRRKYVVTIHDIIAIQYPKYCSIKNALYFRSLLPYSIQKADHIIVPSQKVQSDIIKHYEIDDKKISVVHHGINPIFFNKLNREKLQAVRQKYALPENFLLFVGNIEPKKNILSILKAYYNIKMREKIPHALVLAGKAGWKYTKEQKLIQSINKEKTCIVRLEYLPEEDLPAVYQMADVFIFPSLYEGFGFPVLEALASGTPVLISDRGALPEITKNKIPMVNPNELNEIENLLKSLIFDSKLKNTIIKQSFEITKQFDWQKSCNHTLSIYEKVYQ